MNLTQKELNIQINNLFNLTPKDANFTNQANIVNSLKFTLKIKDNLQKNKNSWISGIESINNITIKYKIYNTYLQIFDINGINYGGHFENKTKMLQFIRNTLLDNF